MRYRRLGFILLAFYFVFLGGGVYYSLFFPLRYFHHAFMTVVLSAWLLRRIRRNKGLPETPLNLPIYALVVVWFVAAITGLDPRMSFEHTWFLVIHTLIFFVLVDLMQQGRQRWVMEAQFILAALVVVVSLLEIASWYFGLGITPQTQVGWIEVIGPGAWLPLTPVRLQLAFGISTWLGAYVAPLVLVAGAWALTARQRDFRRVLWILAGALALVTLLTFSRGAILSTLCGIGVFVGLQLLKQARQGFSRRAVLSITGLIGMGVAGLIGVWLISQNPARLTGDMRRLDMWRSAAEMVSDEPLLGVGTGMYGRALRSYRNPAVADDDFSAAHNLYLNIAAEIGIIGLGVGLLLALLLLRVWWQNWRKAASPMARLRHEAVCAALVGVAVHSIFDTFALGAVVSVYLVLLAYSVAGQASKRAVPATGKIWTSIASLVIVLGFGVWFLAVDAADLNFQRSLRDGETQLASAVAAANADPALRLYPLQVLYLSARAAETAEGGLSAYEEAVMLEPTWDTGWLNMAALAEQQGDVEAALAYLEQARKINYYNPGALHWARLAEATEVAADEEIIAAYVQAMDYEINALERDSRLPLSLFWSATPLRREALEQYLPTLPVDLQYRIADVHFPARLEKLIAEAPQTAAEWWVKGEYTLSMEQNAQMARDYFDEAIARDRTNGDYYVSRARAMRTSEPENALRDLKIAQLLGTKYEYPDAVRAQMTDVPEAQYTLKVNALPPRVVNADFEAVLFSRFAGFDVLPAMRSPGPGRAAMQPWYDIAAMYEAEGDIEGAARVYLAILDYAPDETEARAELARLNE